MPFDPVSARAYVTDVELHSLELAPRSDLLLLLVLAGFALGLSLFFLGRPNRRRQSAAWALGAGSLLAAAASTIFLPILIIRNRVTGDSMLPRLSLAQIAWSYALALVFAWILSIVVLRTLEAKSNASR
jgi:hypothetical protein